GRGPRPQARPARRTVNASTQLDGLRTDSDPLGPHLDGVRAIRIADDGGFGADAQLLGRQAAPLHPRWRRQHDGPRLARSLEPEMPVRMLVPGFANDAGQRQFLAVVVAAPAVMGVARRGRE